MIRIADNSPGLRGRVSIRYALLFTSVASVCTWMTGCSPPRDDGAMLAQIAAGGDYQDWDALRPQVRDYLLHNPDDILGHYYYGLSFLHGPTPQLTFAEGEFLTALRLLEESDDFPTETAGTDRYTFSGLIHRKTALAYMRGYREALQIGLPESYRRELLQKANDQVEKGLEASPTSIHLKEYAEFLRGALGLDARQAPKIITERQGGNVAI